MGKVIGIDLGTTFSAVAYINNSGKPEIISNRDGDRIMPSVVFFEEDGNPIVGNAAKNSALIDPLNSVQFIKRQMGNSAFKFVTEKDVEYTPEEISAIILKRLKEDAEDFLNDEVLGAVITVPAYFNDAQRKATHDAGRIAGLNILQIINEPTAAALAYIFEKINEAQTILVYDLGGGTFDVTIMEVKEGEVNVIASGGDKNLGGFDWDNEVMIYLGNVFKAKTGIDLFEDPVAEQHLRSKSEEAKKTLSSRDKVNVILSASGQNASIELTREKLEELTLNLLNRTKHILEFTLEDANLAWNNIDKILLAGGSSRMKAVDSFIYDISHIKPSKEIHPDEAIALGAAFRASLAIKEKEIFHESHSSDLPLVVVKDVTSHSMGIVTFDSEECRDVNSIILRKDSRIPCKKSDVFYTVSDNQRHLLTRVTQGESLDVEDVIILGEATLEIPPYPEGAPVEVFFSYDINGIIHVSVTDLTSNKPLGEIHIKRSSNLEESEVLVLTSKISKLKIN